MAITPDVLEALVEFDRGRRLTQEPWLLLQNEGLITLNAALTDKGKQALLTHYRLALAQLNGALTRDAKGYWWVHDGRNSAANEALDMLLGKPEPKPKARAKGPRKPVQVIR